MISDYRCPGCRRIRRRPGMRPFITSQCGCSQEPLKMARISWSKVDWTLVTPVIAKAMDISESVIAAKRRQLQRGRGTVGRKLRTDCAKRRKVDPDLIDVTISAADTWRMLQAKGINVSQQRVRQIKAAKLQEMNAFDVATKPAPDGSEKH